MTQHLAVWEVKLLTLREQATKKGIPPGARWTKIDRRLVNPEALEAAHERFEERLDCVIVLRVLTKEEIQKLADRTREIRGKRHHSLYDPSLVKEEDMSCLDGTARFDDIAHQAKSKPSTNQSPTSPPLHRSNSDLAATSSAQSEYAQEEQHDGQHPRRRQRAWTDILGQGLRTAIMHSLTHADY